MIIDKLLSMLYEIQNIAFVSFDEHGEFVETELSEEQVKKINYNAHKVAGWLIALKHVIEPEEHVLESIEQGTYNTNLLRI